MKFKQLCKNKKHVNLQQQKFNMKFKPFDIMFLTVDLQQQKFNMKFKPRQGRESKDRSTTVEI